MIRKLAICPFIFFLFALSVSAHAKTLYVDATTGDDSVTYEDNSSNRPWKTIGRAAWGSANRGTPNPTQAAKAGDTVIVRSGTYSTTGTGIRYDPAYNPVNSGTSTAPIAFQAEGTVILTQTGQGPLIGANGNNRPTNYITWTGFTIYEINALATSDTGPVVLWSTTGSKIDSCTIDGWDNGRLGDNHNGIRIENTTNIILSNNKISNVLNFGRKHMNGAGIMAYYSTGALIENNEIHNCGSGVFIKGGDNSDFTVRYNHVYNNGHGILIQYTNPTGDHRIYQNLVCENDYGIHVRLRSHNVKVVNNTLVNNTSGICIANWQEPISNISIENNILSQGSSELISGGEFNFLDQLSIDRNNYHGSLRWSVRGTSYTSLDAWRAALGGCPGNRRDCNSIVSDPLFVNGRAGDFRLQPASPARSLGRDILNLTGRGTSATIPAGAYIIGTEVIGIVSNEAPSAPASPKNLRLLE